MQVSKQDFRMEIATDPNPDTDYLLQDEFAAEREKWYRNEWWHVYVKAYVTLHIPVDNVHIIQRIESPGLYGVEEYMTPECDKYHQEIYRDECATLEKMLVGIGVSVVD